MSVLMMMFIWNQFQIAGLYVGILDQLSSWRDAAGSFGSIMA